MSRAKKSVQRAGSSRLPPCVVGRTSGFNELHNWSTRVPLRINGLAAEWARAEPASYISSAGICDRRRFRLLGVFQKLDVRIVSRSIPANQLLAALQAS